MTDDPGVLPFDETHVLAATGARLKLLRELAGLSQRELAKRAGVTNSSISTIEQGQVSPSVQSLARILAAIPISFSDFFSFSTQPSSPQTVQSFPRQLDARREILSAHSSHAFQLAREDLSGVVIEGVLTLVLLEGAHRLMAGETFYVRAGQLFRLGNTESQSLQLFLCSLFDQTQ